jgi:hypothetical protein
LPGSGNRVTFKFEDLKPEKGGNKMMEYHALLEEFIKSRVRPTRAKKRNWWI